MGERAPDQWRREHWFRANDGPGVSYYTGAPVDNFAGRNANPVSASEAEDLFQEAAGEYVGWKVHKHMLALLTLRGGALLGVAPTRDLAQALVDQVRNNYNQSSNFGYTTRMHVVRNTGGIVPTVVNDDVHTTRPIYPQLREWINRDLGFDSITDDFDRNTIVSNQARFFMMRAI
jgi:hypothetical protein